MSIICTPFVFEFVLQSKNIISFNFKPLLWKRYLLRFTPVLCEILLSILRKLEKHKLGKQQSPLKQETFTEHKVETQPTRSCVKCILMQLRETVFFVKNKMTVVYQIHYLLVLYIYSASTSMIKERKKT